MRGIVADLRVVTRTLLRRPLYASVVVCTVALGTGATTAVYAVVEAVLLRPLAYADPAGLVALTTVQPESEFDETSPAKFNAWRRHVPAVSDLSAYRFATVTVSSGAEAVQVPSAHVSERFFALFRFRPSHGRGFLAEDDRPGASLVVVMSHGLWQRQFGGDTRVVGSAIVVNGVARTVVGVLDERADAGEIVPFPDVWLPLQVASTSAEHTHLLRAAGRVDAASAAVVEQQLQQATEAFRREFPTVLRPQDRFSMQPLQAMVVAGVRPTLVLFSVAVLLVLAVACANVANLVLARVAAQERELLIRVALGARRRDLVRQVVLESGLISIAGGALGAAVGLVAVRMVLAFDFVPLPRLADGGQAIHFQWRMAGVAGLVSLVTALTIAALPAVTVSGRGLAERLRQAAGRMHSGPRQSRIRAAVVTSEIAVSVVLVVGALLLAQSAAALRSVDPGFATETVLTVRMALTDAKFRRSAAVEAFVDDGVRRVETIPGVVAAAATCCVPLAGRYGRLPIRIVGEAPPPGGVPAVSWAAASARYFEVLEIPIRRGRGLEPGDHAAGRRVAVVSETLARRFWGDRDPVGRQVVIGEGMGPTFQDAPRVVVGVVGDARDDLAVEPGAVVYVPLAQVSDGLTQVLADRMPFGWVIRTQADPTLLAAAIQRELRAASGGLPAGSVAAMSRLQAAASARALFRMVILALFAGVTLLLASVGIYGLLAYSVEQRHREFGVRLSLGAAPRAVRNLVVREAVRLCGAGVAGGLLLALGSAVALRSFLFGVAPSDPLTLVAAGLILLALSMAAAYLPARKASRIEPSRVLAAE